MPSNTKWQVKAQNKLPKSTDINDTDVSVKETNTNSLCDLDISFSKTLF